MLSMIAAVKRMEAAPLVGSAGARIQRKGLGAESPPGAPATETNPPKFCRKNAQKLSWLRPCLHCAYRRAGDSSRSLGKFCAFLRPLHFFMVREPEVGRRKPPFQRYLRGAFGEGSSPSTGSGQGSEGMREGQKSKVESLRSKVTGLKVTGRGSYDSLYGKTVTRSDGSQLRLMPRST